MYFFFPDSFPDFRFSHVPRLVALAVQIVFGRDRHFPTTPCSGSRCWRKWRTTHRWDFDKYLLVLSKLTNFLMYIDALFVTGWDCWGLSPSCSPKKPRTRGWMAYVLSGCCQGAKLANASKRASVVVKIRPR